MIIKYPNIFSVRNNTLAEKGDRYIPIHAFPAKLTPKRVADTVTTIASRRKHAEDVKQGVYSGKKENVMRTKL